MTDKELITALRCCSTPLSGCGDCPIPEDYECFDTIKATAADRLEALLAENERLKAQLPKWVSVEERLPKHDEEVLVLTAPGTLSLGQNQVVAEYIHPINEKFGVFINFYAGYDDKNLLSVTHWQPLPETPSTEGVE